MMFANQARSLTAAVVALAIVAAAPTAARPSEARRTPDDARTLISTDVGDERWAITWNDSEDRTITGNVFFSDGREPAFLWCEDVGDEADTESVSFSCFGADACTASPCLLSQWAHVQDVTVPISFFDAPNLEWLSTGDPVTLPLAFLGPPEEGDDASRSSGVQITVDDERVLINKNVGRERWAITRNVDDQTLTGNIFTTSDAAAGFIWCDEIGFDEAEGLVTYACQIPGTNPPPTPTPKPTPTPTPAPILFKDATYEGVHGCDQFKQSYPRLFTHLNPLSKWFGTCWQCPSGFDRSLLAIDGNSACLKGGFIGILADYEPAMLVGYWGCEFYGDNAFRRGLTNECWSCPIGYERTPVIDIEDDNACALEGTFD